ncbi:MAG: hypothetical protein FJ279_35845, partial [Planctomycetes bacterium]|nr:hypothetical protein [Planctomycetota bacterium]
MNSFVIACVCTGFAVALASGLSAQELKCVQKPIAWMVGQENRIVIETPGDCGQLEVAAPKELELFDRWPWRQGDTQQKLYFRAKSPLAEGRMAFKAGRYSLDLPVQVLSWPQAREPRQFEKYQLPRIFPIEGKDGYKQGITFVDEEWLGQLRKEGLPNADSLAKALPDLETLFYRMPASTVPRAVYVELHTRRGCPVCGPKIYQGRSAFYPWVLDYEKHPWKVGCPDCGRWFPSNDFAKGDMHSGDMPDDGWGYFPKGEKYPYCFISYYACMAYIRHYRSLPYAFAEQYSRSGDRRFARAAVVSLFRIAEQFFNLALNLNMRKTYTRQAVWNGRIVPQSGVNTLWAMMFVECNWEAGLVGGIYAPAYEMLWDYLQSDDAELLSFLQAHGHPEVTRMADVRQFIEDGYFRTAAQACMDGSMIGNQPQGQRAAAELALFLNSPRSPE